MNTETGRLGKILPDQQSSAIDHASLLQQLGEFAWDWHVSENEIHFSEQFQELLGYPAGEWGHHLDEWFSRIHPEDAKSSIPAIRACLEGRTNQFSEDHRLQCRDGQWKWVRARGVVIIKSPSGRAVRLQGLMSDITVQRERKEQILRSQAVLANLSRELPRVFFYQFQRFAGGHCTVPYASDAIDTVHGVSANQVRDNAATMFSLVHPDDIENLRDTMKESAMRLHVWHLDYRLRLKNGERHLFGEAYPTRQDDGSVIWHGFLVDVTDRKIREQQMRATERQLHAAMRFTSLGMFDMNVQTGHGQFAPEYAEILGLSQDYFNHTEKFWDFFWNDSLHPDDVASLKLAYQNHFKSHGEIAFKAEFRLRAKSGEWRWMLSVGNVVEWDENGRALRMIGTHLDITERKKHELEVKHYEDLLRSGRDRYKKLASELEILFSHTPIGLMLVHNKQIMRANPKLAQVFGYRDPKEMIGLSVLNMHANEAAYQDFRAIVGEKLQPETAIEVIHRLKRKDGSFFEARLVGRILPFDQTADTMVWMVEA
ncbi:PAS domain-containing protein [Undibacterium cyanobacteriorum]|uniref:histidine kinase n=1 Tax=Undibacterium cyanobacteriorum TaxID=3073561 RepID=A0ABY9RII0_9BURK|nr:PAS domain-containing protein [Undibacterium sp. 20NA77.5]WMW80484.1 PAS domain-containing protein [Undibacterium sp. 20NA77.5]